MSVAHRSAGIIHTPASEQSRRAAGEHCCCDLLPVLRAPVEPARARAADAFANTVSTVRVVGRGTVPHLPELPAITRSVAPHVVHCVFGNKHAKRCCCRRVKRLLMHTCERHDESDAQERGKGNTENLGRPTFRVDVDSERGRGKHRNCQKMPRALPYC